MSQNKWEQEFERRFPKHRCDNGLRIEIDAFVGEIISDLQAELKQEKEKSLKLLSALKKIVDEGGKEGEV